MKKKTILVSGASGIVGYGILKSLRIKGDCKLIGTTIHENSVAPGFCDIFEKAPKTISEEYFPWLLGVIEKYDVDMIIPSIEDDVIFWSENRAKFEGRNCFPLLNNSELIRLCSDKWTFYQKLKEHNSIYAIPTYLDNMDSGNSFPLILKPRRGYASKGISIVHDEVELENHRADLGSKLMLQPIVGNSDEEYTTSAFFDKDSKLCCFMTLKRTLSKEGFTEKAVVEDVDGMQEALVSLSKIFKPVGPTNFQFRKHLGVLKLLEINPRVSSATSIRMAFGYNESAISVSYFLDNIVPNQPAVQKGYAVRYTEDMVFYENSANI
jgi:carbamoyl-phosphate synthase large subunit